MRREFDAVVLAGGRSSRLAGSPKALLRLEGQSLLRRTLEAVRLAHRIAVVGPAELADEIRHFNDRSGGVPEILLTREEPPFAGPAAGIAAGFRALGAVSGAVDDGGALPGRADLTLILACDMPRAAQLPQQLLSAVAAEETAELWLPVDSGGRAQPLASCADSAALERALAGFTAAELEGLPVRKLLAGLATARFELQAGATDDVDTWADADHFGIPRPAP
ncbi:molybdopterin-guanine dinucleotide biosynthesis protein (MobA) [Arthrobacter crystallopoietes BAB-32]|uniref:Molybdopterin-guanine dinucleotide biosynthesis protein (MobA) n=1 Tax=Arthrobacter crystallopoietes BAB-32 TaxID=1246476 RepID=N1UWS3_9MICC|nr:NTP transferase domain-containing protein [Arthrobacter crystallopoietes]EMY34826.1 molybdopterin-guanine dinucleotide biosynthesis protein (MobA) [Arthrobacter crystallopoietes BAB-32]